MNWYKQLKYAQIWTTESDGSFDEELQAFYELEYKHQALKNFPFTGSPQRYENIVNKVEEALWDSMLELKDTLISTFSGWLDSHALTDPSLWAEKRTDPHGEGFMSSYDAKENLQGIVGEYLRYKNGGQFTNYNRGAFAQAFQEILTQVFNNPEQFQSLNGILGGIQEEERDRLETDLNYDGFEDFGMQEIGEPFQSDEQALNYIEERVESVNIQDYIWGMGEEPFLGLLEAQGQLENFLVELNQHIVFPLWYDYWGAMGIDTTREMAEEAYEDLANADTFEEFHKALEVAIQTCHQNGSMLDYLSEYGQGHSSMSPEDIESLMLWLTEGKSNAKWDKQLKEIGVKIPASVRKHNLEMAKE